MLTDYASILLHALECTLNSTFSTERYHLILPCPLVAFCMNHLPQENIIVNILLASGLSLIVWWLILRSRAVANRNPCSFSSMLLIIIFGKRLVIHVFVTFLKIKNYDYSTNYLGMMIKAAATHIYSMVSYLWNTEAYPW